jgi:hypothetical protein
LFSWLASHTRLLPAFSLYFQSLKQKSSLAAALRKCVVSAGREDFCAGNRNEGKNTMFTEDKVSATHKGTRRHNLLSFVIALFFALTMYSTQAQAQIIGDIDVNIPFQFHVGSTRLPPGEYRIHVLDNSDLSTMEITSMDRTVSALFQVEQADINSEPTKTELIFNKYGNRYFLARMFDEGNPSGSQVAESHYEKKLSQGALEGQIHVPARHRAQQGK